MTHQTSRRILAGAAVALGLAAGAPAHASPAKATPSSTDEARSFVALQKMQAEEVMRAIDQQKKGYVTREEFVRFQEALFARMDQDRSGTVDMREWMGSPSGGK